MLLNDVMEFNNKLIVGFVLNTGNPENAIIVYLHKNDNIVSTYFDSKLFGNNLNEIDCFSSKIPMYFVSCEHQLVGLDRFFIEGQKFKNPYSNYYMTISELKTNCVGETFNLD